MTEFPAPVGKYAKHTHLIAGKSEGDMAATPVTYQINSNLF